MVTESEGLLNKQQRKKIARKQRKHSEREAHRNLDAVTAEAIDLALALAPEVAAGLRQRTGRVIDVPIPSLSEAEFIRKRVNGALQIAEWLDDVRVWIWRHEEQIDDPLSDQGIERGFELRLSQARSD